MREVVIFLGQEEAQTLQLNKCGVERKREKS